MSQPLSLPTVAVNANVQRAVAPDSYVVTARPLARAADSATAAALLTARFSELEGIVAALTQLALEVERGGVSVHPDWESLPQGGDPRPTGWLASRDLRVIGRDLSRVADVVGAVGRTGDVLIDGPHWQLDRDNPVHTELAAEAVHEAIARAGRYAAALGGTLGRLVELTDNGLGGGAREMTYLSAARMDKSDGRGLESLDFTPQPIEVYAGVQGRWYLNLPD